MLSPFNPIGHSNGKQSVPFVIPSNFPATPTLGRRRRMVIFNELRQALQRLRGLPLFALFLSTTGKISEFTTAIAEDFSIRVTEGKLVRQSAFHRSRL